MYNLAAGVTLLLPVDLLHVPGNGLHRGYRDPPESEVFRLLLTRIDLHHEYSLVSANGPGEAHFDVALLSEWENKKQEVNEREKDTKKETKKERKKKVIPLNIKRYVLKQDIVTKEASV